VNWTHKSGERLKNAYMELCVASSEIPFTLLYAEPINHVREKMVVVEEGGRRQRKNGKEFYCFEAVPRLLGPLLCFHLEN
jgi:hypothetical protein